MDTPNGDGGLEITPSKVIKKSLSSETVEPVSQDTEKARLEYDSRLYSSVSPEPDLEYYRLFSYFDFNLDDRTDDAKVNKIKAVYDWARRKTPDSKELIDIIRTLGDLELSIGRSELGVSKLDKFFQYVALENQIKDLEDQKFMKYGR